MAERKTRNVSLPPEQDRFIDQLVAAGHYRTASEVVRDGLRLLQESEHRRMLEKWICERLSPAERERLPTDQLEQAAGDISNMIAEGIRAAEGSRRWQDPVLVRRLAEGVRDRVQDRTGQLGESPAASATRSESEARMEAAGDAKKTGQGGSDEVEEWEET